MKRWDEMTKREKVRDMTLAVMVGTVLGTVLALLTGCGMEVEPLDPEPVEVEVAVEALGGLPALHGDWCSSKRVCRNIPLWSQGGSEWFGEGEDNMRPLNLGRAAVVMATRGEGSSFCSLEDPGANLQGWYAQCSGNGYPFGSWVLKWCGQSDSRFDVGMSGCRIFWPGGGWSEGYWFGGGRETYVIKRCGSSTTSAAYQPTFRRVDDRTMQVCIGRP